MAVCTAIVLALISAAILSGCSGRSPVGGERAEELRAWLDAQEYSSYETFSRAGAQPAQPSSPDGLTLGSPNVFAAIGCEPDDVSAINVFWCDRRTQRPLAKPLVVHVGARGPGISRREATESAPLKTFPEQRLRRVRHTCIAVSESKRDDLSVTCVDFAPMAQEHNFLARWFLVENTGTDTRLVRVVLGITAPGEPMAADPNCCQLGETFAVVSDGELQVRRERIEVGLGRLRPGERASAALLLTAVDDPGRLPDQMARARAALPDLFDLLEQTKSDWESWCLAVPLRTGEERMDDLLDSLLCLVRAHIGPEAIHTGSLRYPHNRAWVRDSYWVQRALLELGRTQEARLNLDFFHRAWRDSGIASYYEIPDRTSTAYGYHGVELPHYLVLMVRDAEQKADVDGAGYWDMVSACLDAAAVPSSGLQPMNGDETWLLAAPVRELDYLLDSSWLLAASAGYGAELAARMGDVERATRYQSMSSRARKTLDDFLPSAERAGWLAVGRGADGSLDCSLCPGVLARGAILGVLPSTAQHLSTGLRTAWTALGYDRGLRTHPRSTTISGGTPGYVLWAGADCPGCMFVPALAERMLQFSSATGCVWEFHDLHDPSWGGEKRRLWDSAVLLAGLVHASFEVQESATGPRFVPRGPLATAPPAGGEVHQSVGAPGGSVLGDELLSRAGRALILHRDSAEHAAHIARELTRQCNRPIGIARYDGKPPTDESAVILSRGPPPGGWRSWAGGYWTREWDGPPQLWVRNTGRVFADTENVLTDLLLRLTPQRERPAPYPDANYELAARFAGLTSGEADVSAFSPRRRASGRLKLPEGEVTLSAGDSELTVRAGPDRQHAGILDLEVSAAGPRSRAAELTVTLPPGWWLVYARDMTGRWDRVRDPVGEAGLPDGRTRLSYHFSAGEDPIYLSFDLARLEVPSF